MCLHPNHWSAQTATCYFRCSLLFFKNTNASIHCRSRGYYISSNGKMIRRVPPVHVLSSSIECCVCFINSTVQCHRAIYETRTTFNRRESRERAVTAGIVFFAILWFYWYCFSPRSHGSWRWFIQVSSVWPYVSPPKSESFMQSVISSFRMILSYRGKQRYVIVVNGDECVGMTAKCVARLCELRVGMERKMMKEPKTTGDVLQGRMCVATGVDPYVNRWVNASLGMENMNWNAAVRHRLDKIKQQHMP